MKESQKYGEREREREKNYKTEQIVLIGCE